MEHLKTRWAALAAAILIALMPVQAATANPMAGNDYATAQTDSETASAARAGIETAGSEPATLTEEANLRNGPAMDAPVEAILAAGTAVTVVCWADGDAATINGETSLMWLYVTRGGWVHSLLTTPVDVPPCGAGSSVLYGNCDEAREAGAAPVRLGEAGYGLHLDRDRDGVGCEWDS